MTTMTIKEPAPQSQPELCLTSDEDHSESSESIVTGTSTSTSTGSLEDLDIPSEFLCPLTLELMEDPVMDKQGLNFERSAIVEWLGLHGHATHPLTRQPLTFSKLVSDVQLRLKIRGWKQQRGIATATEPSSDSRGKAFECGFIYASDRIAASVSSEQFLGMIEVPASSTLYELWNQQMQQQQEAMMEEAEQYRLREQQSEDRRPRRRGSLNNMRLFRGGNAQNDNSQGSRNSHSVSPRHRRRRFGRALLAPFRGGQSSSSGITADDTPATSTGG